MKILCFKNGFFFPFLIIAIIISASSCRPARDGFYLYDLKPGVMGVDKEYTAAYQKLQVGDVVTISITHPTNPELVSFLSPMGGGSGGAGGMTGGMGGGMGNGMGLIIDKFGNIELPLVGQLHLAGYTTREAREVVRNVVNKYASGAWVDVRVNTQRVFVLVGDHGGSVAIPVNERLTLLEALATSGVPNSLRKDRVWILREENGERKISVVDANSAKLLISDFYYLRNNDLVYVEPNKINAFFDVNAPIFRIFGSITSYLGLAFGLYAIFTR